MNQNESLDTTTTTNHRINPIYQTFWIILTMSCIIGLIIWRSNTFKSDEKSYDLKPITPEKINEFGGFSGIIQTGLFIDEFQQFSIEANNFIFDGIVWFKFNPGEISLDTIEKFSFEKGTLLYRSPAETKIEGDALLARYNIRLQFSTNLQYKNFPLDHHRINIVLTNKFTDPSEVIFDSEYKDLIINSDMSFRGWSQVDKEVETGYTVSELDPSDPQQAILRPTVVFSINYARTSIRYTLSIILPLALVFFVSLFGISLPLKAAITGSAAGVTAILAYRFVIENLSPRVGFFMMSDYLFFIFLGMTLLIFIINVSETYGKRKLSHKTKILLVAILHLIIIFSTAYLIIW